MAVVPFVRDRNLEDETRGDETEFMSPEEEGAKLVGMLLAIGVGVLVEFVVPEAGDGEGCGCGEVGGGRGTDVHDWFERRGRLMASKG